jgi:uncharacterized protein (TIGR02118 family)
MTMLNRRDFMAGAVAGAGAMAVLSSEPVPAAAEPTASLNVLYPHQEGAKFDLAYYRTSHIPLVTKVMKATNVILIEGVPTGTTPAPFVMIAHIQFASAAALQAGLADPGMAEVRTDVAKFTDIRPTIMLGRSQ